MKNKNITPLLLLSVLPLLLVACTALPHESETKVMEERVKGILKEAEGQGAYMRSRQSVNRPLKIALQEDDLSICSGKPWLEACQLMAIKNDKMNQWEVAAAQGAQTLEHEKPLLPTQNCGGRDAQGREIFIEDNPSYLPSRNRTCY